MKVKKDRLGMILSIRVQNHLESDLDRLANKKRSGVLSLEAAALAPILLSLFMLMYSLLYAIVVQENIQRAISYALDELGSDIYISSKLIEGNDLYEKFSSIPILDGFGINVNASGSVSKAILESRISKLAQTRLSSGNSAPFWLKDNLDIEIIATENTIFCDCKAKIRLPILSNIMGELVLNHREVQAARGAGSILNKATAAGKEGEENGIGKLTICKSSLNGISGNPVYHDSKCFGRNFENPSTNIEIDVSKAVYGKGGTISYGGKTFHYCPFCAAKKKSYKK